MELTCRNTWNIDLGALIAMVQMLNRKGLTKIRIPDPDESENL